MRRYCYIYIALLLLLATACKPTEKNYRTAYDIAQQQKQAQAELDADLGIPQEGFVAEDGPAAQKENGETLLTRSMPLSFVEVPENKESKAESMPGHLERWNVAVGGYKMTTNAFAQVEALRRKGYAALCGKEGSGVYYVIAATFADREEAVKFMQEFRKKNKKFAFIGMPGATLIEATNVIRRVPHSESIIR